MRIQKTVASGIAHQNRFGRAAAFLAKDILDGQGVKGGAADDGVLLMQQLTEAIVGINGLTGTVDHPG